MWPKTTSLYRIKPTMWLPWTRNKASCTQSYQILQSQRAKHSAFSLRSTSRQKLSICNFTTFQKARSNIGLLAKLFSGFLHSTSPNKSSENDFLLPGVTVTNSTWYFFCNPLSAHFFLTFYKHDNSSEPIKQSHTGWPPFSPCEPERFANGRRGGGRAAGKRGRCG